MRCSRSSRSFRRTSHPGESDPARRTGGPTAAAAADGTSASSRGFTSIGVSAATAPRLALAATFEHQGCRQFEAEEGGTRDEDEDPRQRPASALRSGFCCGISATASRSSGRSSRRRAITGGMKIPSTASTTRASRSTGSSSDATPGGVARGAAPPGQRLDPAFSTSFAPEPARVRSGAQRSLGRGHPADRGGVLPRTLLRRDGRALRPGPRAAVAAAERICRSVVSHTGCAEAGGAHPVQRRPGSIR